MGGNRERALVLLSVPCIFYLTWSLIFYESKFYLLILTYKEQNFLLALVMFFLGFQSAMHKVVHLTCTTFGLLLFVIISDRDSDHVCTWDCLICFAGWRFWQYATDKVEKDFMQPKLTSKMSSN